MSSLEIAELTGKEHFNVIRDIRSMLEALGLGVPSFGQTYQDLNSIDLSFEGNYKDRIGRTLPCFHLPRDLTMTLITGYSVPLRHKVVTRWLELEAAKPSSAIPTNFADALQLAANQARELSVLTQAKVQLEGEVAAAAPNVDVYDRVVADKNITVTSFAKMLEGINCPHF